MTSFFLAICLASFGQSPRPGDLEVDDLPYHSPAPAFIEAALRLAGAKAAPPEVVERIGLQLGTERRHSFADICRTLRSPVWRHRHQSILRAALGREATPAELLIYHADFDPAAAAGEEIDRLKRRASVSRAQISGTVVNPQGVPVAAALVLASGESSPVRTDAAGRYSIETLLRRHEKATVTAFVDGFGAKAEETIKWTGEKLTRDLALPSPKPFRLRVREKGGIPIELASVEVTLGEATLGADTGPEGVAAFPLAPETEEDARFVEFDVRRAGFIRARAVRPIPPDRSIDVELSPAVVLKGRVLDDEGKPAGGAWVQLRRPRESRAVAIAFADPRGRFSIDAESPERWFVVAEVPGKTIAHLRLGDDFEKPGPVEVRAPTGDKIAGRVLFANGKPAAGARVRLGHVDENDSGRMPSLRAWTDAEGRFELGPAPTDMKYNVQATFQSDERLTAGFKRAEAGEREVVVYLR
jgi:hypothetical protein